MVPRVRGPSLHRGVLVSVELVLTDGPVELERDGVVRALEALRVVHTTRSTTLGCDAWEVGTVEHLLGALAGLGVRRGLRIVVSGPELPLLDGGAWRWVQELAALRLRFEPSPARVVRAGSVEVDGARYDFAPAEETSVSVVVALPACCAPRATWNGDPKTFEPVARARTFALERDLTELGRLGLARHVDPASVLVVGDDGIHGVKPDPAEPARHKLLDLLGDAYVHGGPPRGSLVAERPGHARNHAAFEQAWRRGLLARDP